MAKTPKRPAIRIGRILGGALVDLGVRSPIILPLVAVAFAGPWVLAFAMNTAPAHRLGIAGVLAMLFGPMIVLGAVMQSLLIEVSGSDLRPARADWRLNLPAALRTFAFDLVLNLMTLGLVLAAAALGGVILGVSRSMASRLASDIPWWALAGAVLGTAPAVALLARWAAAPMGVHVEGLDVVGALQRSARLSAGQRFRIALLQGGLLATWPAVSTAIIIPTLKINMGPRGSQVMVEGLFAILGLVLALDALVKVRLYRELATVEGTVGSAALADVFA